MPYQSARQAAFIHIQAKKGVPWAKQFVQDAHGTHVEEHAMGDSMKLGGGGRFKKMEAHMAAEGMHDPAAAAAAVGRRNLGAKTFQKLAAKGRKRHSFQSKLAGKVFDHEPDADD